MCLRFVDEKHDPPIRTKKWVKRWKYVIVDDSEYPKGKIRFPCMFGYKDVDDDIIIPGKIMSAIHKEVGFWPDLYQSGFHVYRTKRDAKCGAFGSPVVPVYVRGLMVKGRQAGCDVQVYDQMILHKSDAKALLKRENAD